ncbi:hypothetical protein TRFO_03547 [Tritrichomonas foetus]|uniref:DUF3447 domain-containing protein n=1 Tax=Tritrichomonas foetus TaxID=1144522 RepID=A0A1J4KML4_9EUKA|nr:hypothetical protein TRFO_03547 [Tritrichomonas foetus]|eukprot:OHT12551.1 hypothetical protein TRFO_03547 [Tritrichomonas foetus]
MTLIMHDLNTPIKNEFEILANLQHKMISVLTCDDSQNSLEIVILLDYLNEISIETNFSIYEGFLHLLVHLSIYFNYCQKNEQIQTSFFIILKELISKHSLQKTFHQSTLFYIFHKNKQFLLFLLEEGIVDIRLIKQTILNTKNKNFFFYFFPEIKKSHPKFFQRLKNYFKVTDDDLNNFYYDLNQINEKERGSITKINYDIRKQNHSPEKIAQIIREDDLDSFIKFVEINKADIDSNMPEYLRISVNQLRHLAIDNDRFTAFLRSHPSLMGKKKGVNLNSFICKSLLENNQIFDRISGVNLLEYSMAFGSINIFRYLWLHKVTYSSSSLEFAIMGGNYEILHALEDESNFNFDEKNYYQSLKYHKSEVSEYLFDSIKMEKPKITEIFPYFQASCNFILIREYFDSLNIDPLLTYLILYSSELQFHLFYKFALQQPNFDHYRKSKNIIKNLFKVMTIFLKGILTPILTIQYSIWHVVWAIMN